MKSSDFEPYRIVTLRGSGRTTRMLEAAIAAAKSGSSVCVMCVNAQNAGTLLLMAAGILAKQRYEAVEVIKSASRLLVGGSGVINFLSLPTDNWDWETMRPPLASRDYLSFIDHAAVERYINGLQQRIDAAQSFAHLWDGERKYDACQVFRREHLGRWPDPEPTPLDSRGEPTKRKKR